VDFSGVYGVNNNVIPASRLATMPKASQAGTQTSGRTGTIASYAEMAHRQADLPRHRNMKHIVPSVYILASGPNGTLYIGVTSDLYARMAQHAQKLIPGFSSKYGVTQLVYFEQHTTMNAAIAREKQLKKWNRAWKLRLIEQMNPGWDNLFDHLTGEISQGPFDPSLVMP
jgi:putative endonuclease